MDFIEQYLHLIANFLGSWEESKKRKRKENQKQWKNAQTLDGFISGEKFEIV